MISDPVALALIAMVGGIAANVVLTWRTIVVSKEAKDHAALAATRAEAAVTAAALAASRATDVAVANVKGQELNAVAVKEVHDAVNGGMAAQKREIAELKSVIQDLKLANKELANPKTPEERLEELRGQE